MSRTWSATKRYFGGMIVKPLLFESHQLKLIRAGQERVECALIDEFAEPSLRSRAFDELFIPGLRQIAEFFRRDVADVNLMGRVSYGSSKIAQPCVEWLA